MNTVELLNSELKKLRKAYGKLKSAKPSITEARNKVDMHFTEVMRLLSREEIRTAIREVLSDYPDDTTEIREFLEPRPSDFISEEVQSVRPVKIDEKFILNSIRSILRNSENITLPYTTVDEFYGVVTEVHERILIEIEESRNLAKSKRIKRVNNVMKGSVGIFGGVAVCVDNATAATIALPVIVSVLIGLERVANGYNTITRP